MTLEEGKALAEQGDINAMCSLGDFFSKQNTGEGMVEAAKWYEMAAKKNVLYAVNRFTLIKQMQAYAGMQIADQVDMGWEFAKKDWEEVYNWLLREMEMLNDKVVGSERIDKERIMKNYCDASYHLALCSYKIKDYQAVIDLLKNMQEKRAKILYGSALFDLANADDEYEYAISQFKFIDGDIEYAEIEKSKHEEMEYAIVALTLSQLYREGLIERGAKPDLEKAVKLLDFLKPYLRNEGIRELVEEEEKHYQKKLFGGYKYV